MPNSPHGRCRQAENSSYVVRLPLKRGHEGLDAFRLPVLPVIVPQICGVLLAANAANQSENPI